MDEDYYDYDLGMTLVPSISPEQFVGQRAYVESQATQPRYARLGFVHGKTLGQDNNWESLEDALATLRSFLQCALCSGLNDEVDRAWADLKTDVDLLKAIVAKKGKLT